MIVEEPLNAFTIQGVRAVLFIQPGSRTQTHDDPSAGRSWWLSNWRIRGAPGPTRDRGPRGEVRIEPKVMAVLELLARTPREVVTRTVLLDTVWAGTVVTEEVLTRCISELRSAFGDPRDAPA